MKKNIYMILFCMVIQNSLFSQNTIDSLFWNFGMKEIGAPESSRGMVVLKNDINIGEGDLFINYKDAFNLQVHDGMNFKKNRTVY